MVSGEAVQVARLQPAPPPPALPDENSELRRLLAKRLPTNTVADDLEKFFSRVTVVSFIKMTVCKKPSTVLLDLDQQPGQYKDD